MMRTLRELWLFFWRDLSFARTYRTVFILEAIEALFGAAMFYYVARFVDTPALQHALPQGGSYFAFSLVGFIFLDYLNAALDTFDRSLEEARDTGTLEHLLITQTSLPVFVAGSAIYPFVATTLRIVVYVAWGAALFGFPLHAANWLAVFAVLFATLLAFSGLGILSASYLLLFKRGNPAKWFSWEFQVLPAACFSPSTSCPIGSSSWRASILSLTPSTRCAPHSWAVRTSRRFGVLSPFCSVLPPCSCHFR